MLSPCFLFRLLTSYIQQAGKTAECLLCSEPHSNSNNHVQLTRQVKGQWKSIQSNSSLSVGQLVRATSYMGERISSPRA